MKKGKNIDELEDENMVDHTNFNSGDEEEELDLDSGDQDDGIGDSWMLHPDGDTEDETDIDGDEEDIGEEDEEDEYEFDNEEEDNQNEEEDNQNHSVSEQDEYVNEIFFTKNKELVKQSKKKDDEEDSLLTDVSISGFFDSNSYIFNLNPEKKGKNNKYSEIHEENEGEKEGEESGEFDSDIKLRHGYGNESLIQQTKNFSSVKITISSPEQILEMSYGENLNSETLNYRTLKAERNGLFCEVIYGPTKDFECGCGIQHVKSKESICEKCKVPIAKSHIRRERMSHISLVSPVINPLFLNYIHLFLDLSSNIINRIISYELYIVTNPGFAEVQYKQTMTEAEYKSLLKQNYPNEFVAETGSKAIRILLSQIDLYTLKISLENILQKKMIDLKKRKIIKLLEITTNFIKNKIRPEWMVFEVLPVLAAGLRPLLPLENGKFVSSDLNDKYRAIIFRCKRLKSLVTLALLSPREMIHHEEIMIYYSIRSLILGDNLSTTQKSLCNIIQGKNGLLRNKMLGKRVDYSARAVITTCAELGLGECGIPKRMLKELYRPFLYRLLKKYGIAVTLGSAKSLVDREVPEIWDLLEMIIKDRMVILNRAPTLHKLSMQAFRPRMISGDAIQLNSLVCTGFNADFDGDQMAVHIPLTLEAQIETERLLFSEKNILSPVSGKPIIGPTKDMLLGLYYLTVGDESTNIPPVTDNKNGEQETRQLKSFVSIDEIEYALFNKYVSLHEYIRTRYEYLDKEGQMQTGNVVTTPGRMILWNQMPKHHKIKFALINQALNKSKVHDILNLVYIYCREKPTIKLAETMKDLGFKYVFASGISMGQNILFPIEESEKIVKVTWQKYLQYQQHYRNLLITKEDKRHKIVSVFTKAVNKVNECIKKAIKDNPLSPMSLIIESGARGSIDQFRQLNCFRGLGLNAQGEVSEFPSLDNYNMGLTPLAYFDSTKSARKGGADRAIATAVTGYLTRRMVSAGQDCIVTTYDCGTKECIRIENVISNGELQTSVYDNIYGRVVARKIMDPENSNTVLFEAGTLISYEILKILKKKKVHVVDIRSPIVCEADEGICAVCYGIDHNTSEIVTIGEPVGILAAQSIGEPGTQLTMKTFQSGNVARGSIQENYVTSCFEGIVEIKGDCITDIEGNTRSVSSACMIEIKDAKTKQRICFYSVPYGSLLKVANGESVINGTILAEIDDIYENIVSENNGFVKFEGLLNEINYKETVHEILRTKSMTVIENFTYQYSQLVPSIVIVNAEGQILLNRAGLEERYYLMPGTEILVEDGMPISLGTTIARYYLDTSVAGDIVSGLNNVIDLLEARHSGEVAILAEHSGRILITADDKNKRKISILNKKGEIESQYIAYKTQIPKIVVKNGDYIEKGDTLINGKPVLQDILNLKGLKYLISYFINSVQAIYKEQGVPLTNQHLEIILKQMLRIVEVTDTGDSHLILGNQYNISFIRRINKRIIELGGRPIQYKSHIIGITQSALRTTSFLSAASFQEPQRIFTEAALFCKRDYLSDLNSNVLMGKLIPAGTGFAYKKYQREAMEGNSWNVG